MKIQKCIICNSEATIIYKNLFDDRHGATGKYDLYTCKKCGFIFTYPRLCEKEIGKFYEKYYPHSKISHQDIVKNFTKPSSLKRYLMGNRLFPFKEIKEGYKVLDIGCGCGTNLYYLSKTLNIQPYGIDPDESAVIIANSLGLIVKTGTIENNIFEGEKFDYIIASQVIEHVQNPKSFLLAANKYLKDNGTLFLSFPNLYSINRKIFQKKWINWHVPYHQNFFSEKSMQHLVNDTGFTIKHRYSVTPSVWYRMQIRSCFSHIKEGQVNPIWQQIKDHNQVINKKMNFTLYIFLKKYIRKFVWLSLDVFAIPIYRLCDTFGIGDASVYILKKKK